MSIVTTAETKKAKKVFNSLSEVICKSIVTSKNTSIRVGVNRHSNDKLITVHGGGRITNAIIKDFGYHKYSPCEAFIIGDLLYIYDRGGNVFLLFDSHYKEFLTRETRSFDSVSHFKAYAYQDNVERQKEFK